MTLIFEINNFNEKSNFDLIKKYVIHYLIDFDCNRIICDAIISGALDVFIYNFVIKYAREAY